MLKAHGDYILPDNVPANEFLNLEGNKLSTSKNWAVWLHEYLEEFPHQQDVLRYTLTANAPESKDNDFTWKDFQARNNNELVAIFGNFINRVVVLTHKYYEGKIPQAGSHHKVDKDVLEEVRKYPKRIADSIERYRFRESVNHLIDLARLGNKYLADEEPWKTIKTDTERTATVMHTALQIAAALAVLSEPLLPHTSDKLKGFLNISKMPAARTRADLVKIIWTDIADKTETILSGHIINKSELLFRKIEDEEVEAQLHKLQQSKERNQKSNTPKLMPQKEQTTYDDFMKMDLRVGEILTAERMPKTDKLMVMTVDTGIDKRTIVSGIAQHFKEEELVGRKVTVLANLAPRKLRGVESQGMILLAEEPDGKLVFVNPDNAIGNGSVIA
jgi:methionyl-tRNA synthetase